MMKMFSTRFAAVTVLAATGLCAYAKTDDISRFDPRMAVEKAVVDTNGVKWLDGKYVPLEGKAFTNTTAYYDRLPSNLTVKVNAGVRGMRNHSSGLQFRFRTDSKWLTFKWKPISGSLGMDHMPSTGKSGIDVYRQLKNGRWVYVKTGRIRNQTHTGNILRLAFRLCLGGHGRNAERGYQHQTQHQC
jgi:hypothetical protein